VVEPVEQPGQLGDGRAQLAAGVGAAQQVRAETADRLTAFVDRDERLLVPMLVFRGLVRTVAE
jgi:hypothetical protein